MKRDNIFLLNKMIQTKCKEFNFENMRMNNTDNVISILKEDWHIFSILQHPLVAPLELQTSLTIEKSNSLRLLCFPHPVMISSDTLPQFIRLCNEANSQLYAGTALGRFWCDEVHYDFVYEVILKEDIIESCPEEISKQLFDVPYYHFKDLHIPLTMLANRTWKSDVAIKYLQELRKNGYVDNSDYGLW